MSVFFPRRHQRLRIHRDCASGRGLILAGVLGISLVTAACGRTEPVASDTTTTIPSASQPAAPATVTVATTAAAQPSSYVIQPGDSLGGIAAAFGISQQALIDYNNLANPDRIAAGQQLLIPPGATSTTTTPTTAAPPPAETTTVETAPAVETTAP